MISNFKNIVVSAIGSRKDEVEKTIYKHQQKVQDIERKIDKGEIKSKKDAMQALNDIFGDYLTNDEYRKIDKELGYKLK